MLFYLVNNTIDRRHKMWSSLKFVIVPGGGMMITWRAREVDPRAILLVNPEDPMDGETASYVSTDYIWDSLKRNTLQNIEDYRYPLYVQTRTTRPPTKQNEQNEQTSQKNSLFLFRTKGDPMLFYLVNKTIDRCHKMWSPLKFAIETRGGMMITWHAGKVDPRAILLVDPEDPLDGETASYVSTDYIWDSLKRNTLQNIEDYRYPLYVQTRTTRPHVAHMAYTQEDDKAIMDFIFKCNREAGTKQETGENWLWQKMEEQRVTPTNHTWQSMKEHYMSVLKDKIPTEESTEKQQDTHQIVTEANPPHHNQQADLEVLPDDQELAANEDILASPTAKRARLDNQAPEGKPGEDEPSAASAGEDADSDEKPKTKEQGTFEKVVAEFMISDESGMDDDSTSTTDTVARTRPYLPLEGPSGSPPPTRPLQQQPVPPTSMAHQCLLDHESHEPCSLEEESVEEVGQRMRALMQVTKRSLQSVTRALIRNSGDWTASLHDLMHGKGAGPFWTRHDDRLLLAGVTEELLHKYGEESVAKRLAYLT